MIRMDSGRLSAFNTTAIILLSLFIFYSIAYGAQGLSTFEKRQLILRSASQGATGDVLEMLEAALEDDRDVVRRTAAHVLVRLGEPALKQIAAALGNRDFQVRIIAVRGMGEISVLPEYLSGVLADDNLYVRREALLFLHDFPVSETDKLEMLGDTGLIREYYSVAPPGFMAGREEMFQREWDRPGYIDPEEIVMDDMKRLPLPREGWKFNLDFGRIGHEEGWFSHDFEDSSWRDAQIETAWHNIIGESYVGVAWYRRDFYVPESGKEIQKAYLFFEAVDENAWVWINGEYAGYQNIGPDGWDTSFCLDVTDIVKYGGENVIAVRVRNTASAGGIWRPVSLLFH